MIPCYITPNNIKTYGSVNIGILGLTVDYDYYDLDFENSIDAVDSIIDEMKAELDIVIALILASTKMFVSLKMFQELMLLLGAYSY